MIEEQFVDTYYNLLNRIKDIKKDVVFKEKNRKSDLKEAKYFLKNNPDAKLEDIPLIRLSMTKGKKITINQIRDSLDNDEKAEALINKLKTIILSNSIQSSLVTEQLKGMEVDMEINTLLNNLLKGDVKNLIADKDNLNTFFRIISGDKIMLEKIKNTFSIEIEPEDVKLILQHFVSSIANIYLYSDKKIIAQLPLLDNVGVIIDYIVEDERFINIFSKERTPGFKILTKVKNYDEKETIYSIKAFINTIVKSFNNSKIKEYTKLEFKMSSQFLVFKLLSIIKNIEIIKEDIKKGDNSELITYCKENILPTIMDEYKKATLISNPYLEKIITSQDYTLERKLKEIIKLPNIEDIIDEVFNSQQYLSYLKNLLDDCFLEKYPELKQILIEKEKIETILKKIIKLPNIEDIIKDLCDQALVIGERGLKEGGSFIEQIKRLVVQKIPEFLISNPQLNEVVRNVELDNLSKAQEILRLFSTDKKIEEYFKLNFEFIDYDYYKKKISSIYNIINKIPSKQIRTVFKRK